MSEIKNREIVFGVDHAKEPADETFAKKEFDPHCISEYQAQICSDYIQFFQEKNYHVESPVNVASGFDSTTKFIGSTISIFKPHFLENRIPENGSVIVQPCIRTQSKKFLYNDEENLSYNTFFSIIGGIANIEKMQEVCPSVIDFFSKKLGVNSSRILIRMSSEDTDLLTAIQPTDVSIEFNTRPTQYYRWKYGMPGVVGRGVTIAIRNEKNGDYEDIGNIIAMDEQTIGPKAVQWGFGVETVTSRVFSQGDPIKTSLIRQVFEFDTNLEAKFADTLMVVIEMIISGVILNKKTEGFELRDYLKGLGYLKRKIGLSDIEVADYVRQYISLKNENTQNATRVVGVIDDFLRDHDRAVERFEHALRNLSQKHDGEQVLSMVYDDTIWTKWSHKFGLHKQEVIQIIKTFFTLFK